MQEARESAQRMQEEPVSGFLEMMEKVPPSTYFGLMIGAILLSLTLFLSGRKWGALFVGLWAPTILSSGLFYKVLHPSR